jgi:hypothetical protein
MNNSVLYDSILSFLSGIAEHDEGVIQSIVPNNPDLTFKEGRLMFMISGLYQQLVVDSRDIVGKPILSLSYAEFRHLLYGCDVNTQLAKKGYIIAICPSDNGTNGKVDRNWYELKPLLS